MSNFTLGRIGLDADIDDVSQWDADGETVTVSFSTPMVAEGGSVARSNAYRQMLLGYAESPDQLFVPVTWADDASVDGYYRVTSAQITPDPDLALEGLYYYTAQLERVQGGFGMPAIQTTYIYHERTNVHDQTAEAYLGTPNTGTRWQYAYEPEDGTYSNQPSVHTPSSSEGGVQTVLGGQTGGSGPAAGELALFVRNIDPSAYYVGAARIEVAGFPIEGRQVPRSWQNQWRLSNGIVELTMDSAGISGDDAIFQLRAWQGSQWGDALPVTILGDDSPVTPRDPFAAPESLTILKNTAEEVIIRLALHVGTRSWPVFLDITCRRGVRTLACRLRRASGTGSAYPGVSFPNHVTKFSWRREGAWVNLGTLQKTNYMWNPRCILDADHWDNYLATGAATGRITGLTVSSTGITTGFRCTATGAHSTTGFGVEQGAVGTTTPNYGLSPSTQYTFSAWVRCSVTRSVNFRVQWRNSSGATIGTLDAGDTAVTANTWTQITVTGTSPSNTARVSCHVRGNSGGAAWTTNDTLDMTGLQCEAGATVDAFWDGDSGMSDAINTSYTDPAAPNCGSLKYTRTSPVGQAVYWMTSPVSFQMDTDGFEPDETVDNDPVIWHFGIGAMPSTVTSGDQGRYLRELNAYYMVITQSDDVVAP